MKSSNPILVVDDDSSIREFISDFLEDEGYPVVLAENGAVALTAAEQQPPGLVILDMRMPILDGHGFLAVFCHRPEKPPPVIAISAHAKDGSIDECVNEFLAKPFNLEDLRPSAGLYRWV